jgi:hypothetical protein
MQDDSLQLFAYLPGMKRDCVRSRVQSACLIRHAYQPSTSNLADTLRWLKGAIRALVRVLTCRRPPQEGPFDVFLSHEGNDKLRIVADLAEQLRAANYRVFVDVESIRPGPRFSKQIEVSCFMCGR